MRFEKYHGLGNDFFITDARSTSFPYNGKLAKALCDRRTGIGGDGFILVRSSDTADIRMQIFNSDGSEAEMCGNGIRCFGKFIHDRGILKGDEFSVETPAGVMVLKMLTERGVATGARVDMGMPEFSRPNIPMTGEGECSMETLEALGRKFTYSSILLGVPHTAVFVEEMPSAQEIDTFGPVIETMPMFPRKTNVNFTRVDSRESITVRTWERGCGATLACGTGSCSAAVMAAVAGKTGRHVRVDLALGSLDVEWAENGHVFMSGPAARVFGGEIELER